MAREEQILDKRCIYCGQVIPGLSLVFDRDRSDNITVQITAWHIACKDHASKAEKPEVCQWTFVVDDYDGMYDTACGETFIVFEETRRSKKVKFCCYCGKLIDGVKDEY